jgi:hypothetical protein
MPLIESVVSKGIEIKVFHDCFEAPPSLPSCEWEFGRDQDVLDVLSNLYNYAPVTVPWVAIGKSKSNEVFITLKGSQKTTDKYLSTFLKYRICTPQETGRV